MISEYFGEQLLKYLNENNLNRETKLINQVIEIYYFFHNNESQSI
jgi:hypothetical protein